MPAWSSPCLGRDGDEPVSDDWVISGVGLVTAAADTREKLHEALCRGLVPRRIDLAASQTGGSRQAPLPSVPIESFDIKAYIQRRGLKDLSRTSQLACAAGAPLATALEGVPSTSVGVVLGSGWGALRSVVDFEWESCTQPVRFVNPLLFTETVPNVPAGQLSIVFGWSAFNLTVSSGTASGLEAIRHGIDLLDNGRAPIVVAGGADELNHPVLRVLHAEGATASSPDSMPFGANRSGPVGGEGACLFVLESLQHARGRGVRPLARVRSSAARFIAPGKTGDRPAASDIAALIRDLLDGCSVAAEEIQVVAASAGGYPTVDREEAVAIREVFGEGTAAPVVVAPKAILGETWGASGPLATAAVVESMRTRSIPCHPRGFVVDPALPGLNLPAEPINRPVRNAVVLAFTDTGHLSALCLSAMDGCDGV